MRASVICAARIFGDGAAGDGGVHGLVDAGGGFLPAYVLQHERAAEDEAAGVGPVLPARLGAVPWVASKKASFSDMFTPGARPRPPTCAARASEM